MPSFTRLVSSPRGAARLRSNARRDVRGQVLDLAMGSGDELLCTPEVDARHRDCDQVLADLGPQTSEYRRLEREALDLREEQQTIGARLAAAEVDDSRRSGEEDLPAQTVQRRRAREADAAAAPAQARIADIDTRLAPINIRMAELDELIGVRVRQAQYQADQYGAFVDGHVERYWRELARRHPDGARITSRARVVRQVPAWVSAAPWAALADTVRPDFVRLRLEENP